MTFEAVIYQIQIVTHLIGIGIICVFLSVFVLNVTSLPFLFLPLRLPVT